MRDYLQAMQRTCQSIGSIVWTDYIYANGEKIAKVDSQKPLLDLHGVRTSANSGCGIEGQVSGVAGGVAGLVIATGDQLVVDVQQTLPTYGGLALIFTNGTGTGTATDKTTGVLLYGDSLSDGAWHHMAGSLTGYVGLTVSYALAGIHQNAAVGTFDLRLANAAVLHGNGSVTPIYTGQAANVPAFTGTTCGGSQLSAGTVLTPVTDPSMTTNYYVDDRLGTAQMETNGAGWPVWEGQFTPFGAELADGSTAMHYKFTGRERDNETGLDYFAARYYASNAGRWMSPDWSITADPLPYARLDNPQSLNLYAYVGNNPLSLVDKNGHCYGQQKSSIWSCIGGFFSSLFGGGAGSQYVVTSTILPAGAVIGGVGHHYIPQSISQDFNDSAQQLSNNITSGPLVDKTKNYYDKLHRAYSGGVRTIINEYLEETGKSMKQLSTSDIKAIIQKMKSAGGEIEEFNNRLNADENPALRDMDEALREGLKSVGEDAVDTIEQTIEECEAGAPCIPPL